MFAGLLFSAVGLYYFRAGKKMGAAPLLILGIVLMVFPYFVSNDIALWLIGFGLWGICYKLN